MVCGDKLTWSLTSWDLEFGRETDIQKIHIEYIIIDHGKHFEGKGEDAAMRCDGLISIRRQCQGRPF